MKKRILKKKIKIEIAKAKEEVKYSPKYTFEQLKNKLGY